MQELCWYNKLSASYCAHLPRILKIARMAKIEQLFKKKKKKFPLQAMFAKSGAAPLQAD